MILDISSLIPATSFLLYVAFTVFGIRQRRTQRIRTSFLLYMAAMSVWSLGSFLMHADTGLFTPLLWNRIMMVGLLAVPITVYHSLIDFTESKQTSRIVLLFVGYGIYGFLLVLNLRGSIVADAGFVDGAFYYSLGPSAIIAYVLSYAFLILAMVLIGRKLARAENTVARKRLVPLLAGGIVLLLGVLVNVDESVGRYPIDLVAATVNGLLIFYAVYKYRLVNYSQVFLKLVVYFLLVVISALVFAGILQPALPPSTQFSFQSRYLISLLVATVAALMFQPVRHGAVRVFERAYFGKRLSYYASLKRFSATLLSTVDLPELVDGVAQKVKDTFDIEWVVLVTLDYGRRRYEVAAARGVDIPLEAAGQPVIPPGSQIVEEERSSEVYRLPADARPLVLSGDYGEIELRAQTLIPLRFRDRVNAWIFLGPPKKKEFLDQLDLETISIFSGQCSIAIENAISFERLRKRQAQLQELNTELQISKNKLEAFFDGVTVPMSLQDVDYNIVIANIAAARFFGMPVKDMIGEKCYYVYFGRSHPCPGCLAQDCLHTQMPFSLEQEHRRASAQFAIQFFPISVPEGSRRMFLEFFQDVSEQTRLREELLQSAKLAGIGTLASGIAHEINNPLAAIIGMAEVIKDDARANERVAEYAEDILRSARHASTIIQDLNSYARKEKAGTYDTAEVELAEPIDVALTMAFRGLDGSRVEVKKSIERGVYVSGKSNELRQVFLNLIVNGIQAMPSGGSLDIQAGKTSDHAFVCITDTGTGIDEEDLKRVFDPFFTTKDPGAGTGLGLSITNQILRRLGGRIAVSSTVGVGTTAEVRLPLAGGEPATVRFVQVRTRRDLEDVFFIQRKILVGERGYREETIHRPADESAFHILAYKGLQPVGTVSCIVSPSIEKLPIATHLPPGSDLIDDRIGAEIDRLAVVTEERGGLVSIGLMMLAYMHARANGAERVFLDVFSDDKTQKRLYKKIGFHEVCRYFDPLEVTVMTLDDRLHYETNEERLNHFLRPMVRRLLTRVDFDPHEAAAIDAQAAAVLGVEPGAHPRTSSHR